MIGCEDMAVVGGCCMEEASVCNACDKNWSKTDTCVGVIFPGLTVSAGWVNVDSGVTCDDDDDCEFQVTVVCVGLIVEETAELSPACIAS